ncbi:uncharacterized protein TNCV_3098901 [Trichonephila clavipes]|nr:uncharacterized protein TNCV_3098901 [Trichonephila clavipes]
MILISRRWFRSCMTFFRPQRCRGFDVLPDSRYSRYTREMAVCENPNFITTSEMLCPISRVPAITLRSNSLNPLSGYLPPEKLFRKRLTRHNNQSRQTHWRQNLQLAVKTCSLAITKIVLLISMSSQARPSPWSHSLSKSLIPLEGIHKDFALKAPGSQECVLEMPGRQNT